MELVILIHIVSDVLDLNIGWGMGCPDGVYCPTDTLYELRLNSTIKQSVAYYHLLISRL